jgi:Icc protein
MKLAFITDMHIPTEEKTARGVDTKKNLSLVLEDLEKQEIQHIVIGGDISFSKPETEANKYLKRSLDRLQIPYFVIPGNHDDSNQLKHFFTYPEGLDELYYFKQIDDFSFICLDSSSGKLSKNQLKWLEYELEENSAVNTIFIHHPIVKSDALFMDENHALTNMQEIQNILFGLKRNFIIFSGHYHLEKTIVCRNIIQHITPSLFIQIDQNSSTFKIDHTIPGYRIIKIREDCILSYVRYIV